MHRMRSVISDGNKCDIDAPSFNDFQGLEFKKTFQPTLLHCGVEREAVQASDDA